MITCKKSVWYLLFWIMTLKRHLLCIYDSDNISFLILSIFTGKTNRIKMVWTIWVWRRRWTLRELENHFGRIFFRGQGKLQSGFAVRWQRYRHQERHESRNNIIILRVGMKTVILLSQLAARKSKCPNFHRTLVLPFFKKGTCSSSVP